MNPKLKRFQVKGGHTASVKARIAQLDALPWLGDARFSEADGLLHDPEALNDWTYRLANATYLKAGGQSWADEADPYYDPRLMSGNRAWHIHLCKLSARLVELVRQRERSGDTKDRRPNNVFTEIMRYIAP